MDFDRATKKIKDFLGDMDCDEQTKEIKNFVQNWDSVETDYEEKTKSEFPRGTPASNPSVFEIPNSDPAEIAFIWKFEHSPYVPYVVVASPVLVRNFGCGTSRGSRS